MGNSRVKSLHRRLDDLAGVGGDAPQLIFVFNTDELPAGVRPDDIVVQFDTPNGITPTGLPMPAEYQPANDATNWKTVWTRARELCCECGQDPQADPFRRFVVTPHFLQPSMED